MASFFAPIVYDPNARYSDAQSNSQRFLIYTNSTLALPVLFSSWYQYLVLVVGAVAFVVPLLKVAAGRFSGLARRRTKSYRIDRKASLLQNQSEEDPYQEEDIGSFGDDDSSSVHEMVVFQQPEGLMDGGGSKPVNNLGSIKCFRELREGDVPKFLQLPYDLHIIPIQYILKLDKKWNAPHDDSQHGKNSVRVSIFDDIQLTNPWATITDADLSVLGFSRLNPEATSQKLKRLCLDNEIRGFVLDIRRFSMLKALLRALHLDGVQSILSSDASRPVKPIDLGLVNGIIFQNACILRDGTRRDFFQAAKLRTALSYAATARQENPQFFIGFHDVWESQPRPSVIRRSHKMAIFHGAVFSHGSAMEPNTFVSQTCLGAFDWLKRDDVIQAQNNWTKLYKPNAAHIRDTHSPAQSIIDLEAIIPRIVQDFDIDTNKEDEYDSDADSYEDDEELPPDLSQAPPRHDFWAVSSQGKELCSAGCYDLREEVFDEQYTSVVATQEHLQKLNMLQEFMERDMVKLLAALDKYVETDPEYKDHFENLATGLRSGEIQIFQGLDSGFTLPDCQGHFWAVSRQDALDRTILYISLKTPDITTTVVHCYLAHLGVSRPERFEIEGDILRTLNGDDDKLHPRVAYEMEVATYSEILFMAEQLSITRTRHPILDRVRTECDHLLIDDPTRLAFIELHSHELLGHRVTISDVIKNRLQALSKYGIKSLPNLENLVGLYSAIDNAILKALLSNDENRLESLTSPVFEAYRQTPENFDVSSDLYALLFFCSIRRRAYEEIYMETTDRCPLFLQAKDQAAVFAELWVLGSQCERYFGIKPRALGHIIYDDYRRYLSDNPPPLESWNGVDVFTAYHKVQDNGTQGLDSAEAQAKNKPPAPLKQRLVKASFLTIFCVPAIVDVCLLTFVGRGLYLTAFMSLEERIMANYATLASLLMTAGVTGWSGSTGGFYLYQSGFINLNFFMVQCLSGGFMLTLLLAFFGFFAFSFQYSWYGGFVFAAYLIVLSTYLNLLGVMATMHREDSPFKSGRLVLGKCLPITLLSPFISSFLNGHDVMIYLIILYVFLAVLIYRYSHLCHEWNTWPDTIALIKESEINEWYKLKMARFSDEPEKGAAASTKVSGLEACEALLAEVEKFNSKSRPFSSSTDEFVKKVAVGHKYVIWILKKESNGQPLPIPYSGTWLVQTKLALANQQQICRGLKEHSPFLLFRNAKYDIAQNVGLFLVALLDRWIAISMSANGHVVNMYYNARARYGIAFGLLYFLLSAVSLDVVLQRYWGQTGRQSAVRLGNIFDFENTEAVESRREKERWFKALLELFWVMVCIFGFTTMLVWLFVIDLPQIILYFTYIVGYSAVIIFQFNRVFTMDIRTHVQIVFMAAAGGYFVGVILHSLPRTQEFRFNDVIALCLASFSAAFGTWLYSDFCDDVSQTVHIASEESTNFKLYSQKLIGKRNTCTRLNTVELDALSGTECLYDDEDNGSLAYAIRQVIADAIDAEEMTISNVLPKAQEIVEHARDMWRFQQVRLLTVDRDDFVAAGGADIFAGSYHVNGVLSVVVGLPSKASWKNVSDNEYTEIVAQLAAEALLHECCEAMMSMSHANATVAELALSPAEYVSARMFVQFAWASTADLRRISASTNKELLRHIALGCDMNVEWVKTPEDVRKAILARAVGRRFSRTKAVDNWLTERESLLEIHDLYIKQCLAIHHGVIWRLKLHEKAGLKSPKVSREEYHWKKKTQETELTVLSPLTYWWTKVYNFSFVFITFIAVVSRAAPDCGRELWYTVRGNKFQPLIVWFILKVWRVCWWMKNFWIGTILLPHNKVYKQYHAWLTKGATRTLSNGLITESHPRGSRSGFLTGTPEGYNLNIYDGFHAAEPKAKDHHCATYDKQGRLGRLAKMKSSAGEVQSVVTWVYAYEESHEDTHQYPYNRTVFHQGNASEDCVEFYDPYGRIVRGEVTRNNVRYSFKYAYDPLLDVSSTNVLAATYTSLDPLEPSVFEVFWCLPAPSFEDEDKDVWITSERIQCMIKTTDDSVEELRWSYDHKCDPTIHRIKKNSRIDPVGSTEVLEAYVDEYGLLAKPTRNSFVDEDLLAFHQLATIKFFAARPLKKKKGKLQSAKPSATAIRERDRKVCSSRQIPTSVLRSALWKQWTTSNNLDAITGCLLDEMILRQEPLLKRYWSFRDAGDFALAKTYLQTNLESIVSSIEISDEVSRKINLPMKPSDLFTMGSSKDANYVISKPEDTYIDTETRVAVIFTDTGCWPDAPGGVSNCRRDLVDGHSTIRNYALTESANEYGIPRFNMETNVQLVNNLPLWGLDGKCPNHGLFENLLQSQVDSRIRKTRVKEDIEETFIPLLIAFIRGCRTHRLTTENLIELTDVVLNMNAYFEENDYLVTWKSKQVRTAWREAWLCEFVDPNVSNPNDAFDIERPTSQDFDEAMGLFISYFFVFSVRVPEHVPRVYQSTHHGISSLYGMILKIRRGTTWGIWDHAIMLRESLLNISPAQCILSISVQTMLIGAMKVAAHLAYMHADVILPCTAIYNPVWEAEIGSDQGLRSSSKLFDRKIDPITNGISSMDKFKPVGKPRTQDPTTIMLSNVQFIKDVKNAILAAGVIINDFGFKNYNLVVYGAQDRQPSYAIETEELIARLGIGGTVKLGGFGSPSQVLKDAWLFMNSSLSEGLPLAIGEAALSGVPIVATEVGATAQVLTDADDPNILYGEIVPPNDPVGLARAQIRLLSMMGPWAKYTTDDEPIPDLPATFTPEDIEWITKRMHAKTDDRQALGLRLREVVLRKFNGDRYLREHEQMYWVQRHMATQRADEQLEQIRHSHPKFGETMMPKMLEPVGDKGMKGSWQKFNRKNLM